MSNSMFSKNCIVKAFAIIIVTALLLGITYQAPVYADEDENYTVGVGNLSPKKGNIVLYRWKKVTDGSIFDGNVNKIYHFILVDPDNDHYYHGATYNGDNGWYRMYDPDDENNFFSTGVLVGGDKGSNDKTIDFSADEFVTRTSLNPLTLMYTGIDDVTHAGQKKFAISGAFYLDIDKNPNNYITTISYGKDENKVEYKTFIQKYWYAHDAFLVGDTMEYFASTKDKKGNITAYNTNKLAEALWSIQFGVGGGFAVPDGKVGMFVAEDSFGTQDTRLYVADPGTSYPAAGDNKMLYGKDNGTATLSPLIMYVMTEVVYSAIQSDYTVPVGNTLNLDGNALAGKNVEVGLFLEEGKKLTIPAGSSLSLEGNFINNGTIVVQGTLIVQKNATIVTFGQSAAKMGDIKIEGGCMIVLENAKIIIPERGRLTCSGRNGMTCDIVNFGTIISANTLLVSDTSFYNKSSGNVLVGYTYYKNLMTLDGRKIDRSGSSVNLDLKYASEASRIDGSRLTRFDNAGLVRVYKANLRVVEGTSSTQRDLIRQYKEAQGAPGGVARADFVAVNVDYKGSIIGEYNYFKLTYDSKGKANGVSGNNKTSRKFD